MPASTSRRTLLAAAVTVPAVTAGCTLSGPTPRRTSDRRSTEVDPDVALLEDVAARTDAMVALYEAVLGRHRSLRPDLRPFLDHHRRHARALGDAAPRGSEGARGRRRGRADGDGSVQAPRGRGAALRRLVGAERTASAELLEATRRAESGPFARLLASMSASSAQAQAALGQVVAR
jgi:hypothetical protein